MITPEQAADNTEAIWLARATGRPYDGDCGWCEFALWLRVDVVCGQCPVVAVFGVRCYSVPEIEKWLNVRGRLMRDAALEVYELAVRMRPALVEEAHRILEEADVHTCGG